MKIFGKAQVDVNLSLGQLLKNVMFEEAEPEFQQYAFFKTHIGKILCSCFIMTCLIIVAAVIACRNIDGVNKDKHTSQILKLKFV